MLLDTFHPRPAFDARDCVSIPARVESSSGNSTVTTVVNPSFDIRQAINRFCWLRNASLSRRNARFGVKASPGVSTKNVIEGGCDGSSTATADRFAKIHRACPDRTQGPRDGVPMGAGSHPGAASQRTSGTRGYGDAFARPHAAGLTILARGAAQ